jgi:serine/threonine protein kinase
MAQMCPACSRDNADSAAQCAYCREPLRGLLAANTLLEHRYRVTRVLGCGGMGAVYLAEDTRIPGRQVAVKENLDPSAFAQFQAEVNVMTQLRHPNLPAVSDRFVGPNGRQYIVMDFIPGDNLEEVVKRRGPLPEHEVIALALQLLEILEYLHANGIIHRDIKPANIKLMSPDRPVLVDFGIAKRQVSGGRTQTWARGMGSPGFAPIEQYTGGTDARSDLYSLGAVMYYLLTGRVPPEAPRLAAGAPLPPPRQLRPDLTLAIQRVIFKAMAPAPGQRYQSAAEMRQTLRALTSPSIAATGSGSGIGTSIPAVIGLAVITLVVVIALNNVQRGTPRPTSTVVALTSVTPMPMSTDAIAVLSATIETSLTADEVTDTPTPSPVPSSHTPTSPGKTSTPTPTETSIPGPYALVNVETLNVRTGPGTAYDRIAQVREGERLLIVGRNQATDWLKVKLTDGKMGWVAAQYVNPSVSAPQLPVVPAPPTPTSLPTPFQPIASNTHDFSGSQGGNGWWYQVEQGRNSGHFIDFPNFGGYGSALRNCWQIPREEHVRICEGGEVHPGVTGRIAYRWRSSVSRSVRVIVHAHKIDTRCGDGVWIGIFRVPADRPPEKVGEFAIGGAEYRDRPANTYRYDMNLGTGDWVMVMVDVRGESGCDQTRLYIDIY